jgi:hypothetical protein
MSTQKLTHEIFIERAYNKFKNRYLYTKTKYVNKRTKVIITCRIHGDMEVLPLSFLKNSCGCVQCAYKTSSRSGVYKNGNGRHGGRSSFLQFCNNSKKYTDYYIQQAKKVHGNKYKYLPITTPIISKEKTSISFICPDHGKQTNILRNHLKGSGCVKCGHKIVVNNLTIPFSKFLEQANKTHNSFYTYDESSYTKISGKVAITCPHHGTFLQKAISHAQGNKCPQCSKPEVSSWKPDYWKGKPTTFYVLSLPNNLYKLGITCQKSVATRYNNETTKFSIIFEHCFLDGYDARLLEIDLLKKLKAFNYKGPTVMTSVKNSEIFTVDPSSIILTQAARIFS